MSQTGKESQAGIQHTSMQLYLSICRALPLLEEFLGVVTEVSPPLSTTQLPCCPRGCLHILGTAVGGMSRQSWGDLGRIGTAHSRHRQWGTCLSVLGPPLLLSPAWKCLARFQPTDSTNSSGETPACPVVRP